MYNHLTTVMGMICIYIAVVDVDECSNSIISDTCNAGQGAGAGR